MFQGLKARERNHSGCSSTSQSGADEGSEPSHEASEWHCSTCTEILVRNFEVNTSTHIETVAKSVVAGCRLCTVLRDAVSNRLSGHWHQPARLSGITAWDRPGHALDGEPTSLHIRCIPDPLTDKIKFPKAQLRNLSESIDLFTLPGEPSPWGITATQISGDTSSEAALACAKRWITDCEESHKACTENQSAFLPKRVLDLRSVDKDKSIRLYESSGLETNTCYVCLSHRWGDSLPFITTSANLSGRKQGFQLDVMPKTFREVVTVARKLHVNYLWIDSVCIIQDDVQDWREQSAEMARIYRNAYFNIVAVGAVHNDAGLFSVANEEAVELSYDAPGFGVYRVFARPTRPHPLDSNDPRPEFPLLSRGWFLQERLLSRRLLYFGPSELIWECTSQTACECSSPETRHYWGWIHTRTPKAELEGCLRRLPNQSKAAAVNQVAVWRKLIKEYTQSGLTYERDIFPALAGLARVMSNNGSRQYAAGLWKDTFVGDLLWGSDFATSWDRHRPGLWRAPTWSWASICGPVQYWTTTQVEHVYVSILDVQTYTVGSDPYGELKAASVTLRGPVVKIILRWNELMYNSSWRDEWQVHLPNEKETRGNIQKDYQLRCEGRFNVANGSEAYLLKVAATPGSLFTDNGLRDHWLVLRCVDEDAQTFERLGINEHEFMRLDEHAEMRTVTII